jgi:poly(3-hydroxybutyrate) depolymerase
MGRLRSGGDDVAFIRAVLDNLAKTFPADARRVYATGPPTAGAAAWQGDNG